MCCLSPLVHETVPEICKSLRQDLGQYCSNLLFFWICLHRSKSICQLLGLPRLFVGDLQVYQYLQCELVIFNLFRGHIKAGIIWRYLPLHGCIAPLEFLHPYPFRNHLLLCTALFGPAIFLSIAFWTDI